ncbi:O6-methylguanine-DNA methyltransferase [Ameyamaea chiangmaiensis NBRC 103196]|uniref:methylated-DNA--[protein]-cysteine S-methyltransferase n=1 Tax=Ameyamaea chiangmaiensis TaxID=442969 RepID=A0A850PGB2_9PROT|nr:bifunctional DNA-binding transcriptional regulator/O6-methylguanine-DNA methyltransferase Ada [Ameyamaea chiangmaiensis]MBS4075153.1 bifunctional DNA-binding transcriptional regulator/O6-methylguanine-DNA methyltransferase Ada [Ameyamaea chiangmaiensis]NVN40201.1 bifunctional DNA-binding transcriptional regulator/O6-methylguanine-DNA methyltransferase Ada [Ameyamaea chiangmaiensis]GBQ66249.1 O6-methylguanine-DNA methyltransferase [Ameyamaea chiangmaiensis NBRC 103196]
MTRLSTIIATADDPRWARVVARDRTADGSFWYSVATTSVYCRPSCPSRTCNPKNVTLHATLAQARATGCRACRRCDPDAAGTDRTHPAVLRACRMIEGAEDIPALRALAAHVGLSAWHLHRLFKAATGVTPHAYATAHRHGRVRHELGRATTITDAYVAAGFGSGGRFYSDADAALGMSAGRYRDGGSREDIQFALGVSTLGHVLVASASRGVAAILLGDDPKALLTDLATRFPKARLTGDDPAYRTVVQTVIALIEEPAAGLALPLDIRGTAFQHRVWQALRAIPVGTTLTYTDLARQIGAPAAVRAVASACAANPLAVAVPCHRIVRADGGLAGYAWGVDRKRALLQCERAASIEPCSPRRSTGSRR